MIDEILSALKLSETDPRYISSLWGGGTIEEFEEGFARYLGTEFALTTSSCTTALHTALIACGIKEGAEVITSPYTWGGSISPILHQNAIPVFADIDRDSYTLDPKSVEERITPQTKAILVVHIFGHPADMDTILEIAKRHNLKVIEDCAQAMGASYKGKKVGTFGDAGCFSLGYGKPVGGGEGGILVTNAQAIYERAVLVSQHPFRQNLEISSRELTSQIDSLGYNYRIHPLSAVIAISQLKDLDKRNEERRLIAELLSVRLKDIPGIKPPMVKDGCWHIYYKYSPTFIPQEAEGISRDTYIEALAAEGVPICKGYVRTPIHLRQVFQTRSYFYGEIKTQIRYSSGDCPVAEERCANSELEIDLNGVNRDLVEQIAQGFIKVTENPIQLRGARCVTYGTLS